MPCLQFTERQNQISFNKLHNTVLSLKCVCVYLYINATYRYKTHLVHFWSWSLVSRQQVCDHAVRPVFCLALMPKGTSLQCPVGPNQVLYFPSCWYKYMCNARVGWTRRMIQLKTKAAFNTDFLVYTELLAATFVCVETKASSFIGSTSLTSTVCQTKKKWG